MPSPFQAPVSMKSVLQAGWLLTVAFGNIIVLIVAQSAPLVQVWLAYITQFLEIQKYIYHIFSLAARKYE